MENIIKINNLNYKDLFNNLDIIVKENQFITISGPNNCGKTTLMRILNKNIKIVQAVEIFDKDINDYKIDEYQRIIQSVIPKEIIFLEEKLERELYFHQLGSDQEKHKFISFLTSGLKIKKLLTKQTSNLTTKEIILAQIAIALSHHPKILLIDNLSAYFNQKELITIFDFLNNYRAKYGLTVIITTINLDISLFTDYLYIINNGQTALSGIPLEVLQKDNIINKLGLELPFMIDLSVKLRDYELVDGIETDLDRMIDKLWN